MGKLAIPSDPVDRAVLALCGHVAETDDGAVFLRRSFGRRASGRKRKYWLHGTAKYPSPTFKAETDEDAVIKANNWLARNQ